MASQSDEYLLGYLGCFVNIDNSFFGGILITNEKGMPKEFRHTGAVRPTKVQQLLYGDSLAAAIGANAIGPALLAHISSFPDILLIEKVGKPMFGDFVLDQGSCAFLTLASSDDGIFMDSVGPGGMLHDAILLKHANVSESSIYAYVEASVTGPDPRQVLEDCQHKMNLYSPFERIRTVLQHIVHADGTKSR